LTIAAVIAALLVVGVAFIATRAPVADEFIESLSTPAGHLTQLVLSPDGRHIAAGSAAGGVVVVHRIGERVELVDSAGGAPLTSLAFTTDGLLVAGDRAGRLRAWQAPDFTAVELQESLPAGLTMTCAVFRSEGASLQIILGLTDGRLVTIDEAGTRIRKSGHRGVKTLILSDSDGTLISAGTEGSLIWHDLAGEKPPESRTEHQTEIPLLAWSSDGSRMASADWDGEIRIWDAKSRKVVIRITQPDAVSGLVWIDERIVTGSWDGHVRVWRVTGSAAEPLTEFDTGRPIHALVVESATEQILTVSGGDSIDVWRLSSPDGPLEP